MTYVAVREDSGLKSLSNNERDFLCSTADQTLRLDGRSSELRKVRLQLGRWENGAESTVQWGVGTRVTALVTAELVPPLDKEGLVHFAVEASPMASTSFRQGPSLSTAPSGVRRANFATSAQRLLTNRLLRSLERMVLLGGALDAEALVVQPDKWVWKLTVALTILDDGGNVHDACLLAAMAALRHYRKPHVDLEESSETDLPTLLPSTIKEATPLPLHHTPLSISFALLPLQDTSRVVALMDPTDREELVQMGSLSIAMNVHSEICLLDYGGGCELPPTQLRDCIQMASQAVKDLCQQLETTLTEADNTARQERLQLLQQKGTTQKTEDPSPYFLSMEENTIPTTDVTEVQTAQTQAEEAYRQQALDYAQGHMPQAIREDKDTPATTRSNAAGSLIASLLKAASGTLDPTPIPDLPPPPPAATAPPPPPATAPPATETATKQAPKAEKQNAMVDSDDEEAPTVLQAEFDTVKSEPPKPAAKQAPKPEAKSDITDLAMAIKKKKKGKKKK